MKITSPGVFISKNVGKSHKTLIMLHKINSKCALLKQKIRHKHVYYFHLPLLVNEDDYLTAFQSIFLSLFNRSYIVNNLHDLRNERHMHIKQQSF